MEYFIESTAILAIFYIFYKIFLQSETFFNSIRAYFLVGIISALVVPSIVITRYIASNPVSLPMGLSYSENPAIAPMETIDWFQGLIIIYVLGVTIFAIKFIAQLSSLIWFLYSHSKVRRDKYIIIETTKRIAPFSFFNYIVYNKDDFDTKELEQIFAHEKVHADQFHSVDVLLIQCFVVLNWFNPFIWLYHLEMQKNLEYVADEAAQDIVQEKKKYQYLLLKMISPNYEMAIISNFYNSLIKNRIDMLHKNRSNKMSQIKFALIIPVLLAFVFTFNTEVIAQNNTEKKEITKERSIQVILISKELTETELENITNDFLEQGVTVKFKGIKRNTNGEIIAIKIDVITKTSSANYNTNNDQPIAPIRIAFDSDANSISIGNSSTHDDGDIYFVSKDGDNTKKRVVKVMEGGNGVWVSRNEDDPKLHKIKIVETDGNNEEEHLWVTVVGDSTKVKIVEINEDHDASSEKISKTVWVSKDGDEKEEIIIRKIHGEHSEGEEMNFVDNSSENPLLIVDGKEVTNAKLEDIDPSTIETIEVIKGNKTIEKYGDKAKDGVILISTKK